MDPIDPLKMRGFQPPVTAEIAAEAKKKLKETDEEDETAATETEGDTVLFSDATTQLPEKKKEAFVEEAKTEISNLDRDSETFMEKATEKLVDNALTKEYGPEFLRKPEYRQMGAVLKRRLLMDPRYRPIIEDFLGKLLESEEQ